MRIKLHYLFLLGAWLLFFPAVAIDSAVLRNVESVPESVRPLVAVAPSQAELGYAIVNIVELMILTGGVFVGARLSKLELEVSLRPARLKLSRVVDARRLHK